MCKSLRITIAGFDLLSSTILKNDLYLPLLGTHLVSSSFLPGTNDIEKKCNKIKTTCEMFEKNALASGGLALASLGELADASTTDSLTAGREVSD